MIVATAGHIDHGKTLLVRALTGTDCDRLPEEKARGISIDLGFAYWPLPDGTLVGFVDVPGHERFVRNMLAGVCGIDFALLVVAADDGPMPQTIEHLQILDLLGVRRGVVVVSKTDRVDAARVRAVVAEVRALLAATGLRDAPILPTCAPSGEGMPALRRIIEQAAATLQQRSGAERLFRLAVDRAFTIPGSGTVVTGTVFGGEARVGQRVLLSPSGREARVRGLQVGGRAVERVEAGRRCALNLAGVAVSDGVRGDWVVDPELHAPTQHLDVRLAVLPTETAPLAHGTSVHMHLGTADVVGRVGTARARPIAAGEQAIVRLSLGRPIAAVAGDRLIVRDRAGRRTLGGGRVIDPLAAPSARWSPQRQAMLEAMAAHEPTTALERLLRVAGHAVDVERVGRAFALPPQAVRQRLDALDALVLGRERPVALPRARAAALAREAIERLEAAARAAAEADGMEIDALRRALAPQLTADAFAQMLREAADAGRLEIRAGRVRLAGRQTQQRAADDVLWQRVLPTLLVAGATPPEVEALAADLGLKPALLRGVMHRRRHAGDAWRFGEDRFFARETLAALAATAAELAAAQPDARFSAAQFRDAIGTGRTHAIRILELLDEIGVTARRGDTRCMRADHTRVLGASRPLRPASTSTGASANRSPNAKAPASSADSGRVGRAASRVA